MPQELIKNPLFDKQGICYVESILKVKIKILAIGWNNISKIKHPELKNKIFELIKALQNSTQIWESKRDKQVKLYYLKVKKKYLCAICKHYNKHGFLITAYYTYKIKGDKRIWPK